VLPRIPHRCKQQTNPAGVRMRITGMRLFLLALPVVLTALFLLTACGGKGGGGY
jgi:hypothetical protein